MKDFEDYVGRLTEDETKSLLRTIVRMVTIETLIDALLKDLDQTDRDELRERLNDAWPFQ